MCSAYLSGHNGGHHQVGLLLIFDDVGVLVHAEDAGRGSHRQFSHVIQELTILANCRYVIKAAGIEQIFPVGQDHILAVESRQDGVQDSSVPLVGHTAAIIALALKKEN